MKLRSGGMAERYQWIYIQKNIIQINDNGIVRHLPPERLEELLNEQDKTIIQLQEENKQLKHELKLLAELNQKPIL